MKDDQQEIDNATILSKIVKILFKLLLSIIIAACAFFIGILSLYYGSKLVMFITGKEVYSVFFTVACIVALAVGAVGFVLYSAIKIMEGKK